MIGKRFGYSRQTLKHKFPELTAAMIKRECHYNPPLDYACAAKTSIAACTENPPPTVSEIWGRLGRYGSPARLFQKFPEICQQITKRYRARRKRKLDYKKIEKRLQAILEENPPTSFLAVTKRLNISRGMLATKFNALA
jgi:hypothetical protein